MGNYVGADISGTKPWATTGTALSSSTWANITVGGTTPAPATSSAGNQGIGIRVYSAGERLELIGGQ